MKIAFQEAVSRLHKKTVANESAIKRDKLALDSFSIGPPIAKGCSAVVYAASFKSPATTELNSPESFETESNVSSPIDHGVEQIENSSRFIHNFGSSLENPHFLRESPLTQQLRNNQRQVRFDSRQNTVYQSSNQGHSSDGSEASSLLGNIPKMDPTDEAEDLKIYPLALKMMFNYDIQSNAMSILRAMYKETIPAIHKHDNSQLDGWEKQLMDQTVSLPPHPNIVMMFGAFCAQVPNLMHSSTLYPMALPQRINPYGYGRNMSLFLLMKRYEHSLCSFLETTNEISMRTRILLFAQLLEAIAHLYRHGVAHRDLKADNILIDLNGNDRHPILVLSDFGCCIADKSHGLTVPYTSMDTDKGGNTALMAPEIINKLPGAFSMLDYSKSDLWACGAIAYEIFGQRNPFYDSEHPNSPDGNVLRSSDYSEKDLPQLDHSVPLLISKLVQNILQRNPNKRLSPDIAANVLQLFLWAPSSWIKSYSCVSSPEILQWLVSLTTKVLYEGRLGHAGKGAPNANPFERVQNNRTHTEFSLLTSFLIRTQLQQIRVALNWIHSELDSDAM